MLKHRYMLKYKRGLSSYRVHACKLNLPLCENSKIILVLKKLVWSRYKYHQHLTRNRNATMRSNGCNEICNCHRTTIQEGPTLPVRIRELSHSCWRSLIPHKVTSHHITGKSRESLEQKRKHPEKYMYAKIMKVISSSYSVHIPLTGKLNPTFVCKLWIQYKSWKTHKII